MVHFLKCILIFIVFLSISFGSYSQYFQTGQDPARLKWRQINTADFQLIYPDYYEQKAKKLAYIFEKVYEYGGHSLNHKPRKISVILHTQNVKSNGLVAWAPKRSEFFTTPHQGIYAQDWLEQLAIHEFRHVVQVDKVDHEMPRIIRYILGEQGTALVFGAYVPWWLIEGDAVVTETILSNYGRGRLPSFLMEHKAQVVEKGIWSYDKAYNGSFRSYVPDHYKLGYYLVGETRKKYGNGIWDSVFTSVGRKSLMLFPFKYALKKNTGMNSEKLYQTIFKNLSNDWKKEDSSFVQPEMVILSPANKYYTNYTFGSRLNESAFIAYRTSTDNIPAFVKISENGDEKVIFRPGRIFENSVFSDERHIVWSEELPDIRWTHSGKSLIRILDLDNNTITNIKTELRAFAPALSQSYKMLAVVEADYSNNYFLSVYSLPDGKLMNRIQSPFNYLFSPAWINDKNLVIVVLTHDGKRLAKVNLAESKISILTNTDFGDLKHLKTFRDEILFVGSFTGKDALYGFNPETGNSRMIYNPRFGCAYPSFSSDGNEIIVSDYTSDGYRLISINRLTMNEIKQTELKKELYPLANALAKQDKGIPDFSKIDTARYKSSKYSKTGHIINFHSWAPVYIDPENYSFSPGFSLMSQNKLGTTEAIIGYKWDTSEKTGRYFLKYTFKGWVPVFDFEMSSGKVKSKYYQITEYKNPSGTVFKKDTVLVPYSYNSDVASVNARLPMNLSRGKYNILLEPFLLYSLKQNRNNNTTPSAFDPEKSHTILYRLYFQQFLNRSQRDVFPDFGFISDLSYRHSPWGSRNMGDLTLLQSVLYLPGMAKTHGIKVYGGFQWKNISDNYGFSDVIRYPRGYHKTNTRSISSFSMDYKFPLITPDWNICRLAYIKRITASVFADYAKSEVWMFKNGKVDGTKSNTMSSLGLELTADSHFLRFYAPVVAGFRSAFIPETKRFYFEMLFSIDFNSL